MSFDADEEILQDFLIEAGEILELLSEQLVDLEQRPDDSELLNAIFRGFHTVKGGAGFLQLGPLVDCCHAAENVFDTLRNGHRNVDADLMDVVLQCLDNVNDMFEHIRGGVMPEPAEDSLIHRLHEFAKPATAEVASQEEVEPAAPLDEIETSAEVPVIPEAESDAEVMPVDPTEISEGASDDITDEEFEQLLDALDEERRIAEQGSGSEDTETTAAPADSATTGEVSKEPIASADEAQAVEDSPSDNSDKNAAAAPIIDDDLFDMGGEPMPAAAGDDFLFGESDDLFDLGNLSDKSESSGDEFALTQDEYESLMDKVSGPGQYDKEVSGAAEKMLDLPTRSAELPQTSETAPSTPVTPTTSAPQSAESTASKSEPSTPSEKTAAVQTNTATSVLPASDSSDEITDSEFEDLLDRLHDGGAPGQSKSPSPAPVTPEPAKTDSSAVAAPITDKAVPTTSTQTTEKAKPAPAKAKPPVAKKPDKEAQGETSVRVDTKRLDDIMNMVGELVLVRNRLVRLGLQSSDESMAKAVANLDVVTGDLQASVMKTRMQPIKKVFGRFPRVVRDLARQLKKEIQLELKGEETDLDKNLVEALADPLVHLVRNAVDHGVEAPDIREKNGKARLGSVVLSAEQEGDHILLTIQDDGGGMDADVLRQKAVDKGIMDQDAADRLTDNECFNLIFAPGFSTKEQISDVSGRGVGMDVVKTKITQLNGTVNIDSQLGKGTSIQIKVPLTLAIMPTLMVMLKEQAFAFPLVNVNEIFHLDLTKTNIVDGQEVVVVREKPIPLFYLKRWLITGEDYARADETAHVVVVAVGSNRVGFVVDQLVGQEEVVIKPLGKMLNGTAGMAGATITGDGRIALILDIPSMLARYGNRQASAA